MRRYCGFSLIEVLLAVGTLAVGMIFIGGTFLVGIHLSGVSAERTTATIVANEAFAKIRIFDVNMADPNWDIFDPNSYRYGFEVPTVAPFAYDEFAYPSTKTLTEKQYFWSALCRRDPSDPWRTLQVTVFVSRKVGAGTRYRDPSDPLNLNKWIDWPVAMRLGVSGAIDDPVLTITGEPSWIGPGYTIVQNSTGDIYRVVKRGDDPRLPQIILDKPWDPLGIYPYPDDFVWVVPPPIGRGKGPCIAVYQTKITF